MPIPTYVIAILGVSPAILTELLWWLIEQDDRDVLGVEVWTTASSTSPRTGARRLQQAIENGLWADLRTALGEKADRLPPLPVLAMSEAPKSVTTLSPAARRWSLVAFSSGGEVLEDIRTPDDAEAVYAALHDRVRTLRRTLPDGVQLIGSLAGGRKTMSAALQSAFSLQARPQDRLLHVLVDHRIESDPTLFRSFQVPDPTLEIPLSEQVTVSEVRFPPLRALLQHTRLKETLDSTPYDVLWGALGAALRAEEAQQAQLREVAPGEWHLSVSAGERVLYTTPLTQAMAETYIALLQPPGRHADEGWYRWLRAHPQGTRPSERLPPWETETDFPGKEVAKNRFSSLKKRLSDMARCGVADFAPHSQTGRPSVRWIPAAAQVTVEDQEVSSGS